MVGKPNITPDSKAGSAVKHDSCGVPLSPLDEEREASMADEGGASGAEMERQEPETKQPPQKEKRKLKLVK